MHPGILFIRLIAFGRAAALALSIMAVASGCAKLESGGTSTGGAPTDMVYAVNPANYTQGVKITPNAAKSSKTLSSFSIQPALPDGLTLDTTTGAISGTPTAITAQAVYTIRATNSYGSAFVKLALAIVDVPPTITYAGLTTRNYVVGTPISSITPTLAGGATIACASVPPLPAGISLSSQCALSGTPNAAATTATYAITATNSGGAAALPLTITVTDLPPAFSYSGAFSLIRGTAVSGGTPTSTGGVIVSCAASPALPAGLALSPLCAITGVPTAIASSASYAITATNSGGSATRNITLDVHDVAPAISFTPSTRALTKGVAAAAFAPNRTGGFVAGCVVAPALPTGLAVASDCTVTGTPTALAPSASYVFTATNTAGSAPASLALAVNDVAPSLVYAGGPYTVLNRAAIPTLTPINNGGAIAGCASVPSLPAGLTLSSACVISGTPTVSSPSTKYTITATNSGGTASAAIYLTVKAIPPNLAYPGSPYSFPKSVAIATVTPTNTGDAATSCASSPTLPAGLSLSAACSISGTPTAITASATYAITATNSAGSSIKSVVIAVPDTPPAIAYAGSPYTYTKDQAIAAATPASTGGAIVSCASSPTLPAGLALSAGCVISGTPTAITASASYTITATNAGGTGSATISITVNDAAPVIAYAGSPYTFAKSAAIAAKTPTSTGGAIVSCASSPALPAGLSLSAGCVISGTPTAVSAATGYTITATNTGGTGAAAISITVNDVLPSITYAGSPFDYVKGTAIATLTPTNTGGAIVSCATSPALPAGLSISSACVISGTPSIVSASAAYTVTATNSAGSASTSIVAQVKDVAPTLAYAGSPFTYAVGTAIATLTPSNGGGAIVSCVSSPALPAGLSLSSACAISGTPSAPVAAASYTVTATNTGGTGSATISITVNDVAPVIAYAGSPFAYTKDVAIAAATPASTGGAIVSCASSPALPAGLALSASCVISGTPTAITASASYTITATNTGGTDADTITIAVNDAAPGIAYAGSPYTFTKNVAIAAKTPANTGGAVVSCASSPALPAGLALSSTCVISGTPTAISAATSYTVTATNSGGTSAAAISIAVPDAAPSIDYIPTSYNFSYTKDTAIAALTPNSTGGAIVSCASSPALPAGLSLAATTCAMTGTPTSVVSAAGYTITATNTGGTSSAVITITVNDVAPAITYAGSPYAFTKDVAIAAKTPANTGGAIVSCSASPALPAGLSLSPACVISGTPTAITASAAYTITATNTGGSATASATIAVNDSAPTLSYAGGPFAYTQGVAIATLTPANTGGAIVSCASSPALPAGLSLAATTCAITGTPSAAAVNAAYTITATNSGGTASDSVSIAVSDGPPVLGYAGSPLTYTSGTAIATLTPTNTGGAATSCASVPALPAGLTLSSACVLSGTPSAVVAAATYTITGTNASGSDAETLSITVLDRAPVISYTPGTVAFTLRTPGTSATPGNSGGAIVSCGVLPALPAGLSLSAGCAITGTPSATSALTAYTVTATNTGGSASTTINIKVKNLPVILFHGLTATDGSFNGAAPASRNIWKTTSDGVDRTALTALSAAGFDSVLPVWSPDGASVAYSSGRATDGSSSGAASLSYNIWKSTSAGASPAALTATALAARDSDGRPAYSPDGSKIAFASKMDIGAAASGSYNIFVMDADGTDLTALTSNTDPGLDSVSPVFSPDGTKIYFSSLMSSSAANAAASPSSNIWSMAASGTGKTRLTSETAAPGHDCTEPAVSPDGLQVAFTSRSNIGATAASSTNIWKMNHDGSAQTALTANTGADLDSSHPQFSPDGSEIAFVSRMDVLGSASDSTNIWRMDDNGLNQAPLTTHSSANKDSARPSYSPDGSRIAFESRMDVGGGASSSTNIFVMNADGTGSPSALTQNTAAGLDSHLAPQARVWFSE